MNYPSISHIQILHKSKMLVQFQVECGRGMSNKVVVPILVSLSFSI